MIPSNTRRIAKNTLMLYFRQILIMLVSLYTVRVVLETLGAEDYGIYNVVAGVVTMFGFLSGSMAAASQRYLAFEIGRGDYEQLKRVFSLCLTIYVLIALAVLVLAETIGLWFVSNKLIIPPERKSAALWVYQFSIISFLFTIMVTPYMAAIIAREDMNIYAHMSIIETILKLGIVFLLRFMRWDKLPLYGLLLCAVTIISMGIYRIVCKHKYQECRFRFYWNKDLFKDIAGYTGWNLYGSIAWIFKNQIVNILINQFFNPAVVAARGIASSVNSAVSSFSNNFSVALNPQIIKNFAANQKTEMLCLMFRGAKGAYFLMYLFTLPIMIEMPFVLSIWLKSPPEYSVLFTRLVLLDTLINSVSYPIVAAIQATGKNKLQQIVQGSIFFLNLPISFIVLLLGFPAYSVMIIVICLTFITLVSRVIILRMLISFSVIQFFKKVIQPICIVSILSAVFPILLSLLWKQNLLRFFIITSISIISICVCIYLIGLSKAERLRINGIILVRIRLLVSKFSRGYCI
jgi:O-antigen/teichoic acid export membrane protein